jgi:hypothetical protein
MAMSAGEPHAGKFFAVGATADSNLVSDVPNAVSCSTAELLDSCCAWVRGYVVLTDNQLNVLAAWILHTWAIEVAEFTPYLHITAPEKGCGKTRLLEALEAVVYIACKTGGMSAAALLRTVDAEHPTILMDEVDAAFGGDKEFSEALRGILNEGFRRGGNYRKCIGKGHELRAFQVFGAKALAGIGKIPDTVSSRSIVIEMRRRTPAEIVKRFRFREVQEAAKPLLAALVTWAESGAISNLGSARPTFPDELTDRQQDISEPLLAIADLAAGEWPSKLRRSLLDLFGSASSEDSSLGVTLLRDIRRVFSTRSGQEFERIHSGDLACALCDIEGSPWLEWDRGRGLTANSLAKRLKPFHIAPQSMRIGNENKKGYLHDSFVDLWERYLPAEAVTSVTGPANTEDSSFSQPSQANVVTATRSCERPSQSSVVTGVTPVTDIWKRDERRRFVEGRT